MSAPSAGALSICRYTSFGGWRDEVDRRFEGVCGGFQGLGTFADYCRLHHGRFARRDCGRVVRHLSEDLTAGNTAWERASSEIILLDGF